MEKERSDQENKYVKFARLLHTKIHGLRMVDSYKPTKFEQEINVMICELYENKCEECKERLLKAKYGNQEPEKKRFGGLFG